MSLSLATALIIQHNEVETFALGPFPNGKYGSIVYFIKNDALIKPIISIQNGEFYTCKEAIDKLDNIVDIVRDLDLPIQKEELESISF
jgi:hypothetical protein